MANHIVTGSKRHYVILAGLTMQMQNDPFFERKWPARKPLALREEPLIENRKKQ